LWILAVTSISVYGVTLAGWASNNKYSMLGALRSSANMIRYELSLGMIFAVPVLLAASMSVSDIVNDQSGLLNWYIFHNPLAAAILAIALLAEIGRAPFDMAEAEQELVAGHMTEYSGMKFALFFMAEYINMIGISVIFAALFLGGYDDGFGIVNSAPLLAVPVLAVKVILMLMGLIWLRASIARPRYDRLMQFGWKIMLPGAMLAVAWTAIVVVIAEEGIGDGFYIVSSLVLFALIGLIALWVARATAPKGLGGEDDIFADERIGIGQLILQLIGMLLAIPFAIWENLIAPVIRFITNQRQTQQPAEEKSSS
jgi:NADH-quinone oxidoreductase subunit H